MLNKNRTTKLETLEIMSTVLAPAPTVLKQIVTPKSMISNLRQFDSNWTKFEDQQREI